MPRFGVSECMIKMCTKCRQEKDYEAFPKNKRNKTGRHTQCRACHKEYKQKIWYPKHKEEERAYHKTPEYKEIAKRSRQKAYWSDPERRAERLRKSRERRRTPEYRVKQAASAQRKRLANPSYRIRTNLSTRLRRILKGLGGNKADSIRGLIGCSLAELVKHIESKWQTDMSWENYGPYGWHIDHIMPCASFDLTDLEQQKACYHWTNLQPLWAADNISKSDRLPDGRRASEREKQ